MEFTSSDSSENANDKKHRQNIGEHETPSLVSSQYLLQRPGQLLRLLVNEDTVCVKLSLRLVHHLCVLFKRVVQLLDGDFKRPGGSQSIRNLSRLLLLNWVSRVEVAFEGE